MSKFGPPIGEADFWWQRYFCGLPLAALFALYGTYSLISLHSLSPFDGHSRGIHFVPVTGSQALAMGAAYFGLGVTLFGACYVQNHDRWYRLYPWIAVPGAFMLAVGILACAWIHLSSTF